MTELVTLMLPDALAGKAKYYDPIPNGYEKTIAERLEAWDAERARRRDAGKVPE